LGIWDDYALTGRGLKDPKPWLGSKEPLAVTRDSAECHPAKLSARMPRFTDVKQHPLLMNGNYLSIGPHDLKSIIVGCQAKDEAIQTIRGLVEEHAQHVAVRYARRAPDKYGLVIED
jgi:hypothetical protein